MAEKKKKNPKEEPEVLEPENTAETAEGSAEPENTGMPEISEGSAPDQDGGWKERCLRTTAEYQNYRNRTQKEKEALGEDVRAGTAAHFLPVLDNLERALATETEDEAYRKGVEMIRRQTLDVLAKLRVTEIEAMGKPFDPTLMDAVMHTEDESLPANTVAQVFTKGYRMGDRVLRHAMVQVAN